MYVEDFIKRTHFHIEMVNWYADKIGEYYPEHDADKLYVLLKDYAIMKKPDPTPEDIKRLDEATLRHICNNPHHIEYWTSSDLTGFTRKNYTPNGIIDATKMPEKAIREMCCDWCASSVEYGNTPFEWFERVNGIRWKFTQDQQDIINRLLIEMWWK